MKRREQVRIIQQLGVRPSRKLGQNFLLDDNILRILVATILEDSPTLILEVGAGTGILTRPLLESGVRLLAIEYDLRLAAYLDREFSPLPNFTLIQGDACRIDFQSLVGNNPYVCAGNLPYSISTPLILRLAGLSNPPQALYVLLQKEMADRLAARPACKAYGATSVLAQARYNVQIIRDIARTVFWPVPEIDSSFVTMHRRTDPVAAVENELLVTMVRTGFAQRRKKLIPLLVQAGYHPERLQTIFAALNLDADVRAEALDVHTFIQLAADYHRLSR